MTDIIILDIGVAIGEALYNWNGLDWGTTEPPTEDEEAEVEKDAEESNTLGEEALEALDQGDLVEVFRCLNEAGNIEKEYGDNPTWGTPREAVAKAISSAVKNSRGLNDLMKALKVADASHDINYLLIDVEWDNLPTFGGEEPDDTSEIWSWDKDSLLVGRCADELEIIPRDDRGVLQSFDEDGNFEAAGSLPEWLDANKDTPDLCADLKALKVGEHIWEGGGATPLVKIVRIS